MEIGYKITKPVETQEQCDSYAEVAKWCNENGAVIKDRGEYYEIALEFNGVEYPSFDDPEYLKAKAEQEEATRIASLQPTLEDRVSATEEALIAALDDQVAINEALRAENEVLNDTLLAVFDIINGDTE